jgi:hypothetical protein
VLQIALMGTAFSEDGKLFAYSLSSGGSGQHAAVDCCSHLQIFMRRLPAMFVSGMCG